jgi:hypothetical protein
MCNCWEPSPRRSGGQSADVAAQSRGRSQLNSSMPPAEVITCLRDGGFEDPAAPGAWQTRVGIGGVDREYHVFKSGTGLNLA